MYSTTNPVGYVPFSFNPAEIPGFSEYEAVYSKFRLLKATIDIGRTPTEGNTNFLPINFLIVGSRPFAETTSPVDLSSNVQRYVPPQVEDALRQTRWQKVKYPNSITQRVRVGFKPYTMVTAYGPSTATAQVYQRIYEARKWMPFTWANTQNKKVVYFGPYVVTNNVLQAEGTGSQAAAVVTLTLYCQFSGQK